MLKAGVRKCVYFYFREEIKKKKKGSLLCFGTLPVSALMERQAPCSLPGAAAGFQSRGYYPTWKKNHWNSAGDCFSLALLPLCSTQNGSFESERPKKSVLG